LYGGGAADARCPVSSCQYPSDLVNSDSVGQVRLQLYFF
jgi:hypothetical protein